LPELALIGLTTQESLFVQKLKSLLQQNRPDPDIGPEVGLSDVGQMKTAN
jgi:hypothetical protein